MKERPLIFTAESVRAILDGRKTQTRRVVKPQPEDVQVPEEGFVGITADGTLCGHQRIQVMGNDGGPDVDVEVQEFPVKSAYGVPGDRLWVCESWSWRSGNILDDKAHEKHAIYAAYNPNDCGKYKSPMFMPRWASRITLEITNVRVERVQEIGEKDCIAEGVSECLIPADDEGPNRLGYMWGKDDGKTRLKVYPKTAYSQAWDSLNAKRGYPWASNPWVWVLEFKKVEVSA